MARSAALALPNHERLVLMIEARMLRTQVSTPPPAWMDRLVHLS
jgi:hypothetical protein